MNIIDPVAERPHGARGIDGRSINDVEDSTVKNWAFDPATGTVRSASPDAVANSGVNTQSLQ